jgi:predicted dinucleotide-binding enzyme
MFACMVIAVVGTGFIGGILGGALAGAGKNVTFGSRHPEQEEPGLTAGGASVAPVAEAIAGADIVILALPSAAVAELAEDLGAALEGKIVIDATNQMGAPVSNSRAALPSGVRYARAFNTLRGENMADPEFPDGPADMFFSALEEDRDVVADVIRAVGLRPVYVGQDQEELLDGLFRLWIALAVGQKRGRRLAFRVLEG